VTDGPGIRLGMYIDLRNPPPWLRPWDRLYGRWLERIVEAERLGGEAVWLTEHHFFEDGYLPQCWTLAAAIAARTSRMRIGTAVALLPLHDPVEWAEQIALVDLISGGRVEPGFGLGYRKPEYQAFEGDFKHRYQVFAERITELRRLWGEEPGAIRLITPGPLQKPMPMWGGFGGPRGARLAGRLGLGLQSIDRSLLDPYREGLAAGRHDPSRARMAGALEFFLTDDPDRAWAQIEPHVRYRWESYNRYMFEGTSNQAASPYFDLDAIRRHFLLGSPEDVADGIRKRTDGLPVTDLFGWCDFPGLADAAVDRHIELTFTRLAPLLASAPA
jgi:alkanesulfonate monooxygenase SsuD/methylene tetrahydromethanopterin reductase-like flavin-dependent oxidoreductase (luciferase family)